MAERTASTRDARDTRTSDTELVALRAQLQRERDEKDAARAEADTARRERDEVSRRLTGEVDQRYTAEERQIDESLDSSKSEIERLEDQIAELNEKGEFKAAAKATTLMTAAQARVFSLESRKTALAGEKANAKAAAEHRARTASQDPLNGMSEPAKAWIRRHPRWMTDKAYQDRVTAAHLRAKADGIQVDSDRYFRFIEKDIGERNDDDSGHDNRNDDTRGRRDRDDGGRVADADSPLSGASDLQDADDGHIVVDEDPGVEIDGKGGDDLYEEAQSTVRRAQDRVRTERTRDSDGGARRADTRPSRTSSAAPPSRGGNNAAAGTRPRQNSGGRLTALEAEVALSSYPPGEHPGIKTKEDAYRAYHNEKMALDADGRLSANANRR